MKQQLVKIKSINNITHDVLQIVTDKPLSYDFTPGQATEVAINNNKWKNEKKPFTFTSLPNNNYLEFTIKTYPSHKNITNELLQLKTNDELILHEVFGVIAYKGEGVFIAGGAGVTPFISIFRYLKSKKEIGNNKLIFANKTKADIILQNEFENLLGDNFINVLSDEKENGYLHGLITEDILKTYINGKAKYVYVCGPPPMMKSIEKQLEHLKVDEKFIIKEEF